MDLSKLLDTDGENKAVRYFLLHWQTPRITIGGMCQSLQLCGFGEQFWPEFADPFNKSHLTKAGAQAWLRHLFDIELKLLSDLRTLEEPAGSTGPSDSKQTEDGILKTLGKPKVQPILQAIDAELTRSKTKFPSWPTDPLHALSVLGEEYGELTQAALETMYEPHKSSKEDVKSEAIQTAAMCFRFLESLDQYKFTPGIQHEQGVADE